VKTNYKRQKTTILKNSILIKYIYLNKTTGKYKTQKSKTQPKQANSKQNKTKNNSTNNKTNIINQ